jgi:hypothetical protein
VRQTTTDRLARPAGIVKVMKLVLVRGGGAAARKCGAFVAQSFALGNVGMTHDLGENVSNGGNFRAHQGPPAN